MNDQAVTEIAGLIEALADCVTRLANVSTASQKIHDETLTMCVTAITEITVTLEALRKDVNLIRVDVNRMGSRM
jgi:predicted amino acid-binding ACT domain protein